MIMRWGCHQKYRAWDWWHLWLHGYNTGNLYKYNYTIRKKNTKKPLINYKRETQRIPWYQKMTKIYLEKYKEILRLHVGRGKKKKVCIEEGMYAQRWNK